jgi:cell division septum initiation protein DivIVA
VPPLDQLPAAYLALEQENAVLRAQIEFLKRKLFATTQSDGARQRGDGVALSEAKGETSGCPRSGR